MTPTPPPADAPREGFRSRPVWVAAAVAVVVAQAGLALALFGPDRPWGAVTDDRPVLSGRHPLHLYHGTLGAASFRSFRTSTCYDPAFQAGYPKTPVFDGGSRPAELFALLAGPGYRPAGYKIGVFTFLLLVPVGFLAAARGAGLPAGAAVFASVCGVLVGWCPAVRHMLAEGDLDLLAAGLAAVVFVPWLGRYARQPDTESWLVLAGLAALGWYAHPLIWLGLGPVVFVLYLVYAPRHGPGWHLGLAGVMCAGVVPNLWWLVDWAKFWWLRQPSSRDNIPLPEWETVLGRPEDYANLGAGLPGGLVLPLIAVAGLVFQCAKNQRAVAGLAVVAFGLTVAAARLAAAWPRVPADVPGRVAPLAVAFLLPAAAVGVWETLSRFRLAGAGTVLAVTGLLLVGWADGPGRPLARGLGVRAEPLIIGFSPEQQQLLAAIEQHTTPDARILWDDAESRLTGNWAALLPVYTTRAYIGGLDVEAEIEHGYCALCNQRLNGRPLAEWTDAELTAYCRWYNVGWVVCRGGRTADRWARYPGAKLVVTLPSTGTDAALFAIDRPRSYVLSGTAVWDSATARRVVLTDVYPDADGHVDLSLHAFEGLRVYPSYVRMETIKDAADPIGHIRLKIPGPIPRVTIVWDQP